MVTNIFNKAIYLSQDNRQLPQITNVLSLLRRRIGIHHGGLLPIFKDVIEILFQAGLIKVLLATETFTIGLNMPSKTVVFTLHENLTDSSSEIYLLANTSRCLFMRVVVV